MVDQATDRAGWTRVAFGDVVRLSKERSSDPEADGFERYVGLDHLDPGDLKVRRWGDIADGTTFTNVFRPGQVLFGKRRAYQRKVGVADFSGVCSGDIYVFESKDPDALLPDLLPFICQTNGFFEYAVGTSAGSLSPRTNWRSLAEYEFALPPVDEQRKLMEVLVTMDEIDARLREVLGGLRTAEASVLDLTLERRSHVERPLGDLLVAPPRNGYSAVETDEQTGHYVLSLSAISPWGYQSGEMKAVEKTEDVDRARLSKGDLVVSRSNTRELVGLPALFDEDREDISRPDTMMLLQPDERLIRASYLELFLRSPSGRQQVMSYAAGTSASMKKINGKNLQKVRVPVPTLEAQLQVEETTRLIREARSRVLARMKANRSLKSSFLQGVAG